MHQKRLEIEAEEESSGLFSNFNGSPSSRLHQNHLQFQGNSQSTPYKNGALISPPQTQAHLQIKTPPFACSQHQSPNSTAPSSPSHQPHFKDEPICHNNQSPRRTLLSTPHKRPMMSQSSSLSPCQTLSSVPDHDQFRQSNPNQSQLCSFSLPVLLAARRITLRLIHHSCHASWVRVHMKLFMLLSLPSLYFFTSNHYWPIFLHFLCIIIFSSLLIVSLGLSLPRIPSIRLFLARTLYNKLYSSPSASKPDPPVVWSIGSKPKSEKTINSGSWVQVYSNGDVYEGEFHKGKCAGSGVYYYHMSGRYEGDWIDGKYDGYGVETWAKGSRYRGQYRQGLRHGIGLYRSYTGDLYSGEWCNGQCHGCGVHTCDDGSSYSGEFKWGVKHGIGHYRFRNGDTYAGEYFADKMHGFGVYRFGNGHKYEGAWHEGRRQGFGTYTFRNGESQSGHWQNGALSSLSTIPGSPTVDRESKILNAVQEAHRAAEKAVVAGKVEERVLRAVAAANRAATAARVAAVKAVQSQMQHHHFNAQVAMV